MSDKECVSYPLAAIVYFPLVTEFSGDLPFFKIGEKQISREIGIVHIFFFFGLGMSILILGTKRSARKMIKTPIIFNPQSLKKIKIFKV